MPNKNYFVHMNRVDHILKEDKEIQSRRSSKPVRIFNIKDKTSKKFNKIKDAAEYLKVTSESISYAIKNKTETKGHKVEYV